MTSETHKNIKILLDNLSKSPTGRELVNFAKKNNVKIEMADHLGHNIKGAFHHFNNTIYITPVLDKNLAGSLMTLAHELRHAWQFHSGLLNKSDSFTNLMIHHNDNLNSSVFTMFHEILLERRFAEADAFATSVQVVYELSENKVIPENYLIHLTQSGYPDALGLQFENRVTQNKENAHNGLARRASFDGFFQKNGLFKTSNILQKNYDRQIFRLFNTFNTFIKRYIKQDSWQKSIENPQERKKLKQVFNTSAKDNRKKFPDINHLNKYGHMETGGNYLTDHNGKSLHSEYYMGTDMVNSLRYNHTWKKLQKTAKRVYNYKV